jgi:oligopeptide transport system substrate-binding protein
VDRRSTTRLAWAATVALLALPAPAPASTEKVVRLTVTQEPPQLDSTKATDAVSGFVLGHVKEGLTRYDDKGDVVPGVAASWTIGELRARFRLREDARWSDGKPVTARDFVFAWRLLVDPKNASEYAFIMFPVKNAEAVNQGKLPPTALGVSAPDDHTLEVELEQPCGYFLMLTAFASYMPVREDFYAQRKGRYGADAADLLSNGPFVLTTWVHGAHLAMTRNPHYWDARRIRIDEIDIPYFTTDPNARLNLFKDGKIDMLESIGRDELKRAQAERFKMKGFSDGSLGYLEFNHRPGRATANRNLRKAIQLAIQPAEYVAKVVGIPGTKPGVSLIPSWMKGVEKPFRTEYPLPPVRPDLAEAKRHLELARAELGGSIPRLVFLTGDGPGATRQAEYFQRVLKTRLGIDLRIDRQIFKQRLAKMTAGDFDVVAAGWRPDYADPMTFADLFTSWNENNRGRWVNARYDELIRKAQATSDPRARMDAMAAAERIAFEELPILPLAESATVWIHSRRVDGIIRHRIATDPDFTHATVKDEEHARAWSPTP